MQFSWLVFDIGTTNTDTVTIVGISCTDVKNVIILLRIALMREMHPVSFDVALICKSTVINCTCVNDDKFCFLLDEKLETISHCAFTYKICVNLWQFLLKNIDAVQAYRNL